MANYSRLWKEKKFDNVEKIISLFGISMNLLNLLAEILGSHKDFSMYETLNTLESIHSINHCFEKTIKENSSCEYNRSYVYENVKFLYIPEMQMLFEWLSRNLKEENRDQMMYVEEVEKQKEKILIDI